MLIIPDRQSHWYFPDGTPCHQVESKSGNGLRNTTLRDARERGLVPSVTNILSIKAKPELENWKRVQAVMAALTLPRLESEPLDAFARRVVEDSEAQTNTAADFGRRIHKAVEQWLVGPHTTKNNDLEPWLASFKAWAGSEITEIHAAEKVMVNRDMSYAGTLDLHCNLRGMGEAVVDVKTQGIKDGKPKIYLEWGAQLAAYSRCVHEPGNSLPLLVSIIIDSTSPGPIFCHQWKDPDRQWEGFCAALALWKYDRNYYPNL